MYLMHEKSEDKAAKTAFIQQYRLEEEDLTWLTIMYPFLKFPLSISLSVGGCMYSSVNLIHTASYHH